MLTLLGACQEKTEQTKTTGAAETASQSALPTEIVDLEDCDDKIEKLEEEPVEINLGETADAGCTIE